MTASVLISCMKSLLIYLVMQEDTAGLCHVLESSRLQQVFLAWCWVTVVSCLSYWPQTPVFLQVWLRPQRFPLERLSTQEWLTPNWPEHCPFISMVGASLLSFLNTVNMRFIMWGSAPQSSPGLTLFPLEVCGLHIKLLQLQLTERGPCCRHCSEHFHILSHQIHSSPMR